MTQPTVALVRYQSPNKSLKESIELCDGFKNLKANDNVLIKPNLLGWDNQFGIAPYGVFTTTRLVEDMVILLKEFGCQKIAIGEGAILLQKDMNTSDVFKKFDYEKLSSAYGVDLIDLNKSKSKRINLYEDLSVSLAQDALEADFLINMPVLKTHAQAMVSLGIKNLKGTMKMAGKKRCHDPKRHLEFTFPIVTEKLSPKLTVIDGIYVLEKGPLHFGNAYRKDLIITSRDILGADIVGAAIMGFNPEDIKHLSFFASRNGSSLKIDDYEIKGLPVKEEIQPLQWSEEWNTENTGPKVFDKIGISGIAIRKFDETLCSFCSYFPVISNILAISGFNGKPFDSIEVLNGKKMQASPGFEHTILAGKCIVKANAENPNIRHAIKLKDCPPSLEDIIQAFQEVGVVGEIEAYFNYMRKMGNKYDDKPEYDPAFFRA